jgi:hypothetical protein
MPMLDIFTADAFSVVSLTDAINKLKYVPGRVSSLGIFDPTGITTTTAVIEQRNGVLQLIAPTPRGGPGHTLGRATRDVRAIMVPHFEINDAMMADEVQGIRAFGSETEVETVQAKVVEKLATATQSLAATQEYSRIGAIRGNIVYGDGSTTNLFTFMGVTPPADVFLDLSNATPVMGVLRQKINAIARTIGNELSTVPFTGLYAICGNDFFDDLVKHAEVRQTYLNWTDARDLRMATVSSPAALGSWGVFSFGGILWDNYFGKVGATDFVDPDEAHVFPLGVPGLFRTYYAPADYIETVNTVGQARYARQYEMTNGKGINLDSQMNALEMCTRPGVLVRVYRGTTP